MNMSERRSDIRHHNESDIPPNPMGPLPEPKNVQDLTQYVSIFRDFNFSNISS